MTEEIKGRIEQIKAGQVPEGYIKQYKYIFPVSWKLYHLGELTQNNSRKNMTADELPTYSINNQVGFIPQNEQFDEGSYSDLDKTCYKIVKRGEFAYNPARINVGSLGLLKDKDAVIVSSLYVCFSLKREFSNLYFENWFTTTAFHKEILRNLEGSVREYLFYENFSNIRLPVPPLPEQKKIAEILRQCDKVIELKQSKIEELQKLKKTCLSKMFPKEGHNVPELRFPGFTDAWEQRKLGELVANLSTGKSVNSDDGSIHDGEIGILKTSCVSYDKFDPTENKCVIQNEVELVKCPVKKDCIIVSRMNTPERVGACGYIAENYDNLFLPDRLWQLKFQDNMSSYFIYTMLISPGYKDQIRSMASGTSGSMYNIPKERFLDLQVRISPNMNEQKAIGDYFRDIDNLITLHQRELEETRKYKKALMQLLLTGIVRVQR
jgi:type I restriction enzyme S subunit